MSVVCDFRLKPFQFELSRILRSQAFSWVYRGVLPVPVSGPTLKRTAPLDRRTGRITDVWGCLLMLSFAVSLWVLRVARPGEVEALRRSAAGWQRRAASCRSDLSQRLMT